MVDWSALEHAYGSAESVGESLNALATGNATQRRAALDDLESSIHHQFSRYSASAPAIPILVAMASDPARDDRAAILRLVYGLTVGEPTLEAWDIRDARLRYYAGEAGVAAYETAREHVPTFAALLDDAEPSVRTIAAFLLGAFADRANELLAALRARFGREDDAWSRAAVILAIRSLAVASTPTVATDVAAFDALVAKGKATDPAAVAAAVARIEIAGEDPAAVKLLQKVKKLAAPATFPGDLARFVRRWIAGLALRRPTEVLFSWLEAPPAKWNWQEPSSDADGLSCLDVTTELLSRTLPPHEGFVYRLPSAIPSPARRALLAAMAAGVVSDGRNGHYNSWLVRFGLPMQRSLRRYLGIEPASQLEREITADGRTFPVWWWIRSAMVGEITEEKALRIVIEALSVDERVALLAVERLLSEYAFENNMRLALSGSKHHVDIEAQRRVQSFFASLFISVGEENVERAAMAALAKEDIWLYAPLVIALAHFAEVRGAPFVERLLPLWEFLPPVPDLARRALLTVAPAQREAVLEHWNFNLATIHHVDERGVSDERKGDHELGWAYLLADLCPTPRLAERLIEDVSRWTYPEHPKPIAATVALARKMGAVVGPPAIAKLLDLTLRTYRWRHVLVEIVAAVSPEEAGPFVLELAEGKPAEKKVAKRLTQELVAAGFPLKR